MERKDTAVTGKDALIGVLLIAVVAMAGGIGYMVLTANPVAEECDEDDEVVPECPTTTYKWGLPDDWSTAPNASKIILHNETGHVVNITLGEILNYVKKYEETKDHDYWYEKRLKTSTINDPSGIPITGVDLLDVLRVFDCLYAGEIELVSYNDTASKLTLDVARLCDEYGRDRYTILALAANKQWLPNSLLGDRYGNFSVVSKDTTYGDGEIEFACYNLANITVSENWTVAVKVYNKDGSLNHTLTLDYLNITTNPTGPHHYEYENTAWYSLNRTYYGVNISTIVNYTAAEGTDYWLNMTFSDGSTQPYDNTNKDMYSLVSYFNWTDVEDHLSHNGTHVVGNHYDYVNGSSHMLKSDLRMCLTTSIKFGTEYAPVSGGGGVANYPWSDFYNYGYPSFSIIIPGLTRSRIRYGLTEISITIRGPRA